ncbi:MAG: FtsQ-type POTRA domain-containing protein [Syntrophales bacterium]|jgi:cell division protein FtsQ|nr:FtsQ-type POTRA domain-containing protein [Syntrophales bacterium]MDY0043052.1 FtsQ-type POTRA domain-containing protein [Syntrophales bacterium]
MNGPLGNSLEARKYRLKRRSAKIYPEVIKTFAVMSAAAGLGLLMVYGYNFAICSSYFQLKETAVRGGMRISEETILKLAGVEPSMNILTANLEKMASGIRTNPWVKDAEVGRELPNRLVIEVTERIPAAIIRRDKGFYLVDREGTIFKNLVKSDGVDLSLLTGMCSEGIVNFDLLRGALDLLDFISRCGAYSAGKISEINGNSIYGYTIYTTDRCLIKLGFGDYEKKFRRLKKVLSDLSAKKSGRAFVSINLMESDRIIVYSGGGENPPQAGAQRRTSI